MFCLFHDFVQESSLDKFIVCRKCGKKIKFGRLSQMEREIKRLEERKKTINWLNKEARKYERYEKCYEK